MAKQPQPESGPRNLRVVHTQVGMFPKGHVLSEADLPPGYELQRLLDLGAVEYADGATRSGDAPVGPDNPTKPAHREIPQPGDQSHAAASGNVEAAAPPSNVSPPPTSKDTKGGK